MSKQKLFLGVDCGGTKTEALVSDETGQVLGHGVSDSSNLHNQDLTEVLSHIEQAVEAAQINLVSQPIEVACLGVSGLDTVEDRIKLTTAISQAQKIDWISRTSHVIVAHDGLISFRSGTDEKSGICLISSTGSNCYGINKLGREHKAGDWGYLLGDQGSGFAIGLKLIRAILKEFDGRTPKTSLTPKVLHYLRLKSAIDLIPWVYGERPPIKQIASLTKLLSETDIGEQKEVKIIIADTIEELILAYSTVVNQLKFTKSDKFPVILTGGVFNLSAQFAQPIVREIKRLTPQAEVSISTHTPVYGAIKIALEARV